MKQNLKFKNFMRTVGLLATLLSLLCIVQNTWAYNEFNRQYLYIDCNSFHDYSIVNVNSYWDYNCTDHCQAASSLPSLSSDQYTHYYDCTASCNKSLRGFKVSQGSGWWNESAMGVVDGQTNNCIKVKDWGSYEWATYVQTPTISSLTVSTGATSGTGTESDPYIVTAGSSFTLSCSASLAIADPDMGIRYHFGTSEYNTPTGESSTAEITASSTGGTTTQYYVSARGLYNPNTTYTAAVHKSVYVKTASACATVCDKTIPTFSDVTVGGSETQTFVFDYNVDGIASNTVLLDPNTSGMFSLGTVVVNSTAKTVTCPVTFTPTTDGTFTASIKIQYAGGSYSKEISAKGLAETYGIKGDLGDNWMLHAFVDGSYTYSNITSTGSKEFVIHANTANQDYKNKAITRSNCTDVELDYNTGSNATINIDIAGSYTFTWDATNKTLSVTYPELTYYLKHNWGGEGWSWSDDPLEDNGDGTYSMEGSYGSSGCNWNTSKSDDGASWVENPTLVGSPSTGDNCIFTLNPSTGSITITRNVACTQPEANFAITGQLNKDDGSPWAGSEADDTDSGTGGYFANSHRTITLTTDQTVDTYAWVNDSKPDGSSITWSNQTSQTATAQVSLPGTYTFHLNANCTGQSAVSSKTVTIVIDAPEMGISGPFMYGGSWNSGTTGVGYNHCIAGKVTENDAQGGKLTYDGNTNGVCQWSRTFTAVNADAEFVIIQRYKYSCTGNDCSSNTYAGWAGYQECSSMSPKNNKINNATHGTVSGVNWNNQDNMTANVSELADNDNVTLTVTTSDFDTYNITLEKACVAPAISAHPSTAGQTVCQGVTADALSVTASDATGYQWYSNTSASTSGGSVIDKATNASYTPVTTSAGTTYYYCVVSGCNSQTVTSDVSGAITVIAKPTARTLSGDATKCTGSNTSLTLDGTAESNVVYKLYKGEEVISTTTTSPTFEINVGSTTGNYTYTAKGYPVISEVSYESTCSTNMNGEPVITVIDKPATPGDITSDAAKYCTQTSGNYSVAEVATATQYNWTITGVTYTGESSTRTIAIKPTSTGTMNVSVTAQNTCGTSTASSQDFTISAKPSTPTGFTGSTNPCVSANQVYSVTNDATATSYTWTQPSDWEGESTTNQITLKVGSASGSVMVSATNGCGTSTSVGAEVSSKGKAVSVSPTTITDMKPYNAPQTITATSSGDVKWSVSGDGSYLLDTNNKAYVAETVASSVKVKPVANNTVVTATVTDSDCTATATTTITVGTDSQTCQ